MSEYRPMIFNTTALVICHVTEKKEKHGFPKNKNGNSNLNLFTT